jgi:pimeloyl-ACP methyl ester carboxylesterase
MPHAKHDGIRIHYHVEGSGPPVVLHAGFTLDMHAWYDWGYVDALAPEYQLILVDPRGHGKSDKPHDPAAYEMSLRAGDVLAVLDDLGIEQTNYLGYSMGGRIGFDIAKLAPTRLRSLTIGASSPFALKADPGRTRYGFEDGMAAFFDRQPLPDEIKSPALRDRMLAHDVEALIASSFVDRPDVSDVLPNLAMPCLVYYGDADPGHGRAREWMTQIPDATFVTLPGLDHWAGIYRSDLALPHIRAFLERVTR